jgi:hypothetical protein
MSATFSINIGTPTESFKKQDINSALLDLPDNTQKLISPKDVRDAFLTSWGDSAFKQTKSNNIEYIGIDSGNPSNRDIKQKIYLGKRNYLGSNIMNSTLLNDPNTDIYINNTKSDTNPNQDTRISILAGTNSILYNTAPYIEAHDNSNSIDLNIVNPSSNGTINILSELGRVSINGINFPTIQETSTDASNGKILKYHGTFPNGYLKWDTATIDITQIGSTSSSTNMYGTVSLNGYPLEFIDDREMTEDVGGLVTGMSFSQNSFYNGVDYQNWPVTEIIREILYPFVDPTIESNVLSGLFYNNYFMRYGNSQNINLEYKLYRYTDPINSYNIMVDNTNVYSGGQHSSFTPHISSIVINQGFNKNYVMDIDINVETKEVNPPNTTNNYIKSKDVYYVDPILYGFNSTNYNENSLTSYTALCNLFLSTPISINKIVPELNVISAINTPNPIMTVNNIMDVEISVNGTGHLYFIIPMYSDGSSIINVSGIFDPNGFNVTSSFIVSTSPFVDNVYKPDFGLYKGCKIYKTILPCSYTGTGKFKIKF